MKRRALPKGLLTNPIFLKIALALSALAGAAVAALPPIEISKIHFDPSVGTKIPEELVFKDENGTQRQLGKIFQDKASLLVPVYNSCPHLCSLLLDGLIQALREEKLDPKSYQLIALSFDPKDTPEKAAEQKALYLKIYGEAAAEKNWHFLTGNTENIKKLLDAINFEAILDPQTGEYAHGSGIVVVDRTGKIAAFLSGLRFPGREIANALFKPLPRQNSHGLLQNFVLLCFHYDPSAHSVGEKIVIAMRFSSFILLLSLLCYFLWTRFKKRSSFL